MRIRAVSGGVQMSVRHALGRFKKWKVSDNFVSLGLLGYGGGSYPDENGYRAVILSSTAIG